MKLEKYIRTVHNFPKKGISYKDITPLLQNADATKEVVKKLAEPLKNQHITKVVGIESRGFLFGMLLASELNAGFIPIRKPGKLPFNVESQSYDLEYGTDEIEIHQDALNTSDRIVIHDDVLATGGTAQAACKLIKKLGGNIIELNFLIELIDLKGKEKIIEYPYRSLLNY